MKQYNATNEGTGGETAKVVTIAEPTSEMLTKLREELKIKWAELVKQEAGSQAALDANLEVYKQQKLIEGEIANINKAEAEKVLAEKRNQRVALLTNFKAAHAHQIATHAKKGVTLDEKQAADDEVKKHEEILTNELLAKFAHSTPSKAVVNSEKPAAGSKGATGLAIRNLFIENREKGLNDTDNAKAIIAAGYSRGTTGAVILAYQREIGEKA